MAHALHIEKLLRVFCKKLSKFRLFPSSSVGAIGENHARKYLQKKGFRFIANNWRCPFGELDLIMSDGNSLVIIEVKTRLDSKNARRNLFENITLKKQQQLRLLTKVFVQENLLRDKKIAIRIDAIGVVLSRNKNKILHLRHIKGAV